MTKIQALMALKDFAGRAGVEAYSIRHEDMLNGGRWVGTTVDKQVFSITWSKSDAQQI